MPGERIAGLDVVRGFALSGVLVAYTVWNLGGPPEAALSRFDRFLNGTLTALVDGKFLSLFAFLFGLGFSIQMRRAAARGISVVALHCRRLAVLLAIGLIHALLLRNGDILVPYAILGFLLLPLRNAPDVTLAVLAIVSLFFPYFASASWELTGIPLPQRPEAEGIGYFAENLAWVKYWYAMAAVNWPGILPLFLFGLFFGRRRVLDHIGDHRRQLRHTLVAGACIGVLAFLARDLLLASHGPTFGDRLAAGLLWTVHAWSLAAAYLSSLLLLLRIDAIRRWLAPLGAVGRMALTNYLLQAVLIVPLCLAMDLFGRVTPGLGLLLALAVWSVQVPASVWWLGRYRFGPVEWIWRSLTYRHAQPMRVAAPQKAAARA